MRTLINVGVEVTRLKLTPFTAALLLLLCSAAAAPAQILSQLLQTNVVAGTNRLPVVIYPLTTNGTRTITVANLFSNATLSGATGLGTNSAQAVLHVHKQGSNAALHISGITNAVPADTSTAASWLPITLNGTNYFLKLHQ